MTPMRACRHEAGPTNINIFVELHRLWNPYFRSRAFVTSVVIFCVATILHTLNVLILSAEFYSQFGWTQSAG